MEQYICTSGVKFLHSSCKNVTMTYKVREESFDFRCSNNLFTFAEKEFNVIFCTREFIHFLNN